MEFSLLWRFLTVCGFVQVACQGFLVREACVGVLVGRAGFLLSRFRFKPEIEQVSEALHFPSDKPLGLDLQNLIILPERT